MYSKALLILGTAMIAVFMLMMILVVVKSFESAPAEPIIERADLLSARALLFDRATVRFFNASATNRLPSILGSTLHIIASNQRLEDHLGNNYPIQQPAQRLSSISSEPSDSDLLTVLQQTIPNGPALKSSLPINEALQFSLKTLKSDFDVLNRAQLDVYEIDDKLQLLAFRLRNTDNQAFVIFNFSNTSQTAPLPFGFMSSTKVVVWRSNTHQIGKFVTSGALTVNPHSAMIIII